MFLRPRSPEWGSGPAEREVLSADQETHIGETSRSELGSAHVPRRRHLTFSMLAAFLIGSTLFAQFAEVLVPPFGLMAALPLLAGVYIVVGSRLIGGDARLPVPVGDRRLAWLLTIYVGAELVAAARAYLAGSIDMGLMRFEAAMLTTVFIFGVLAVWRRDEHLAGGQTTTTATYLSIVLFVAVNVALFAVGFSEDPTAGLVGLGAPQDALMLGLLGLPRQRVAFILSAGVNSFGVPAGAAFVVGMMMLTGRTTAARWTSQKVLGAVAAATGGLGVLLVDSRGAMASALVIVVVARVGLRYMPRAVPWLPLALPLVPLVLVPLAGFLLPEQSASVLMRADADAQLNGRMGIWALAVAQLANVSPIHLLGYGLYGQLTSGVSLGFAAIGWGGYRSPEMVSLHNGYLQTIFDVGYLGLGLLMVIVCLALARLVSRHRLDPTRGSDIAVGIILFYLLYGNLEVAFIPSHEGFTLFLLTLMLAAAPCTRARPDRSGTGALPIHATAAGAGVPEGP